MVWNVTAVAAEQLAAVPVDNAVLVIVVHSHEKGFVVLRMLKGSVVLDKARVYTSPNLGGHDHHVHVALDDGLVEGHLLLVGPRLKFRIVRHDSR